MKYIILKDGEPIAYFSERLEALIFLDAYYAMYYALPNLELTIKRIYSEEEHE